VASFLQVSPPKPCVHLSCLPTRVTSVRPYRRLSNLLSLRTPLSLFRSILFIVSSCTFLSIHQPFFSFIFVHHFPLSLFHIPTSQMGGQYSCWKGSKLYSQLQHQQSSRFAFCHPLNKSGMHISQQTVHRNNRILYGGFSPQFGTCFMWPFCFFFW
jgi:hypothetical protein